MNNNCKLLQVSEHPVAIDLSGGDGMNSTCLSASSGRRLSLRELELALAEANRDAAQVAPLTESTSPHFARVIQRRQLAEVSTEATRSIRTNLAKSLSHTLANLS